VRRKFRYTALGSALLLSYATVAQMSSANYLHWTEGGPSTTFETKQDVSIKGFKTNGLNIFVNLTEVHETKYNRAWVQIFNHSKSTILFDPLSVTLVQGKKVAAPENPDDAAKLVELLGEATSNRMASAQCTIISPVGCQVTNTQILLSRRIRVFAAQQAQWMRDNGLKRLSLPPGSEVQGAILFKKDKKSASYLLRIPVGDTTFEFPMSAENRSPDFMD
jgi:hypothetical protein